MAEKQNLASHPFILFWLGLLTGALIVGLVFSYKAMVPDDYQSSLFRYSPVRYVPMTTSIGDPTGNLDPAAIYDINMIGDPTGN